MDLNDLYYRYYKAQAQGLIPPCIEQDRCIIETLNDYGLLKDRPNSVQNAEHKQPQTVVKTKKNKKRGIKRKRTRVENQSLSEHSTDNKLDFEALKKKYMNTR